MDIEVRQLRAELELTVRLSYVLAMKRGKSRTLTITFRDDPLAVGMVIRNFFRRGTSGVRMKRALPDERIQLFALNA